MDQPRRSPFFLKGRRHTAVCHTYMVLRAGQYSIGPRNPGVGLGDPRRILTVQSLSCSFHCEMTGCDHCIYIYIYMCVCVCIHKCQMYLYLYTLAVTFMKSPLPKNVFFQIYLFVYTLVVTYMKSSLPKSVFCQINLFILFIRSFKFHWKRMVKN